MAIGSGRGGISRRQTEGKFSFLHGKRREPQRLQDVGLFEVGVLDEDLVIGHAVGQHRDNRRDGEPEIANAWHSAHSFGVHRDSCEDHAGIVPAETLGAAEMR